MSDTGSNKKNWLLQLDDLSDKEIDTVMQAVRDESGVPNKKLDIHFAVVGMYLNYCLSKSNPKNAPQKTKNLEVIHLFYCVHIN